MAYCKECGSLLIMGVCRNREHHDPTLTKYLWTINGREYRFKRALTKTEAEEAVKSNAEVVLRRPPPKTASENRFVKLWTSQDN